MLSSCQSVAMLWPFSAPTQEHNMQYELKGDVQLPPSKPPIPQATYLMCSYTDINITREREREAFCKIKPLNTSPVFLDTPVVSM